MHRFVAGAVIGIVVLLLVPVVRVAPAFAGAGASDGPGGSVTVGASTGSSSGGSSGAPVPGGPGSSGGGNGTAPVCIDTVLELNNELGPPPGASLPGSWYSITCYYHSGASTTHTRWISTGKPPTAAPPVAPYAVALRAERSLHLPSPSISFNPSAWAVVNLPTWLWVDAAIWHPYAVSASVGTVTATAVATPVSVQWTMGDGSVLSCAGPGTVYQPALAPSAQSTGCSYVFPTSSAGQPSTDGNPNDGAYTVTAAIVWEVSWTSRGAAGGGALPSLETTSTAPLRVLQIESVNG